MVVNMFFLIIILCGHVLSFYHKNIIILRSGYDEYYVNSQNYVTIKGVTDWLWLSKQRIIQSICHWSQL